MTRRPALIAALLLISAALAQPAQAAAPTRKINVLIRGQSNAVLFATPANLVALRRQLEILLGYDGVHQTVTILGSEGRTMWSRTALIPSASLPRATPTWFDPAPGGTWQPGALDAAFLAFIKSLPAPIRAAPTATLWLHNESDSCSLALTADLWARAVRHAMAEERAGLGQPAATTPVGFIYVPFNFAPGVAEQTGGPIRAQAIKQVFQDLAADTPFNAFVAAQAGDTNMNGTTAFFGGLHMSAADGAQLVARMAASLATHLAGYAQPGSPAALGAIAVTGPRAIAARVVTPHSITVQLRTSTTAADLRGLSAPASVGAGWSVVDGCTQVFASTATALPGHQIRLGFAKTLPTSPDARLFYAYGVGRIIAQTSKAIAGVTVEGPGQGAAIYDSAGLPLSADAYGLGFGAAQDDGRKTAIAAQTLACGPQTDLPRWPAGLAAL